MTSLMTADKYVNQNSCRLSADFEILRRSPVFSGVSLDVVKLFAYLSSHRAYKTGEYLITQGKKANQAFLLVKGNVEITVNHRGNEVLLQQLAQGTVFGELALLAQFDWFFNARAAEDLEVIIIDQTVFQKVIEKFPEHKDKLTERVIQIRVDRLVQQTTFMLDQLINPDGGQPKAAMI